MKNAALILLAFVITGCTTLDLPSVEESQREIERLRPRVEFSDKAISAATIGLPRGSHLITKLHAPLLNRLLKALADNRSDDARVTFLQTRPLIDETKSIFGLTTTNYLDIDTGNISINLKRLHVERIQNNRIEAVIELEGKGRIRASGRYLGIPASASPEVELSLNERIAFEVVIGKSRHSLASPSNIRSQWPTNEVLMLVPVPKTLNLKAVMYVSILDWHIPWTKNIPLQLADLIQPLELPEGTTSVNYPLPASTLKDEGIAYEAHSLQFFRASVTAYGGSIEYRTSFSILKVLDMVPDSR